MTDDEEELGTDQVPADDAEQLLLLLLVVVYLLLSFFLLTDLILILFSRNRQIPGLATGTCLRVDLTTATSVPRARPPLSWFLIFGAV